MDDIIPQRSSKFVLALFMLHGVIKRWMMERVDYFGLWEKRNSAPKFDFHKKTKLKHTPESKEKQKKREQETRFLQEHDEIIIKRRAELNSHKDELKRLVSNHGVLNNVMNDDAMIARRNELIYSREVLSEFIYK
jgi:hypothetical protein